MPKKIDDDTLADAPEEFAKPDDLSLTPEEFNFAEWLVGVTPVRETVTIYPDGHAQAEISRLSQQEAISPEGKERDSIRSQLKDLYTQRVASGIDFVIEGRTSAWVQGFTEDAKEQGIEDTLEITLRQIAAQVVSPEGVTADSLRSLWEIREQEVNRLAEAVLKANSQKLGIDPRFLRSASD